MSKHKKSQAVVVAGLGPACARCERPTEIRRHREVTAKHLAQPFYYSEWYVCTNTDCRTTLIMPDDKRVWRSRAMPDDVVLTVLNEIAPLAEGEQLPWE